MAEQFAYLTGGASGIGKAVAQMLVKNKYPKTPSPPDPPFI